MAAAVELFTRGGMDAPEDRGNSMVQKHLEKMQKEKEEAALVAVRSAVPELGPTVCALALEGASWDVSAALKLLQDFEKDKAPQLAALQEKRKQAERGAAGSESDESDSESDESDSDRSRKRSSRKGSKSSRRSSKHKKDKKRSKKRKHESSKEAKRKKSKKDETGVKGVIKDGFGAHGILRETDYNEKRSEFQAWTLDTQNVDVEIMPKNEERELFKTFMEDYNTSTLPHEKYYDLEAYARKKAAKAAKRGAKPQDAEKTAFDDERERKLEIAEQRRLEQAERLRDAYNQLKYTGADKAEDMREQEMLRLRMQQAYRTGDHETAERLKARLAPDDARQNEPPQQAPF